MKFLNKIQEDIVDEDEAISSYGKRVKQAPTCAKKKLRFIRKDEKEHKRILKKLVKR